MNDDLRKRQSRRRGSVTAARLADGRELFYYDDEPGTSRAGVDQRHIERVEAQPEARRDPISEEWVVFAAHRQERTFLPTGDDCPLCPSRPGHATEIPAPDYDVAVFENRFPSLDGSFDVAASRNGLFARQPANGRCEVVCFTSDHDASFARLSVSRQLTIAQAWLDRTDALRRRPGVAYVLCFENRGRAIGVTLEHPHGQIYAYPFMPPRVERALDVAARHRQRTGRCIACEVVFAELANAERVVARTRSVVAFVPFAARWPFEVHIYPTRHVVDLSELDAGELADLMAVYVDVLTRFDGLFETPVPYIAAWMQAPTRDRRRLSHLHAEVFTTMRAPDRLKFLAGSESVAGVFINDVVAEEAATAIRAVRAIGVGADSSG